MEETQNELVKFINRYYNCNEDEQGIILAEADEKYVTIKDAGLAVIQVIEELSVQLETAMELSEVRMKAIVENLPDENRNYIYEAFTAADDDLFEENTTDTEGDENND